jgi:hypothetical protein
MARIIITTDPLGGRGVAEHHDDAPVLLDERIMPIHLRDGHAAGQLIERLAWAVVDAEQAERERAVGA